MKATQQGPRVEQVGDPRGHYNPATWRISSGNDMDDYPLVSVEGHTCRMYHVYSIHNGKTICYCPTREAANAILDLARR